VTPDAVDLTDFERRPYADRFEQEPRTIRLALDPDEGST